MTFHEKLRRLTQDKHKIKVARSAGIPPMTVYNILNKQQMPAADRAYKLARVLSVSVEWLLDDTAGWPPVWVNYLEPATVETSAA